MYTYMHMYICVIVWCNGESIGLTSISAQFRALREASVWKNTKGLDHIQATPPRLPGISVWVHVWVGVVCEKKQFRTLGVNVAHTSVYEKAKNLNQIYNYEKGILWAMVINDRSYIRHQGKKINTIS